MSYRDFGGPEHWNRKEYWTDKNGVEHELSSSMTLMPDVVETISCPICRACLNQRIDIVKMKNGREIGHIYCTKIGEIPEDIAEGIFFRCDHFEENKKSFDYELVKKLMKGDAKSPFYDSIKKSIEEDKSEKQKYDEICKKLGFRLEDYQARILIQKMIHGEVYLEN